MSVTISNSVHSDNKYADFNDKDIIEFLCVSEFTELLELIASVHGYSLTRKKVKGEHHLIIDCNEHGKIRLSSLEDNWSLDCGSDKFILTALVMSAENISYEKLNIQNCKNPDIKLCVKAVSGSSNKYVVISELLNLKGGITIMNLISRIQTLVFNQYMCAESLIHLIADTKEQTNH